jgi:hypothetical protein
MNIVAFVSFSRIFLLGILIFNGLNARRLYKSFGVKGLTASARANSLLHLLLIFNLMYKEAHTTIRKTTAFDNQFVHGVLKVVEVRNFILFFPS